jgi:FKBP-type peptidyl-prolyl cis-trans isomerase (trigger factor)
LAGVNLIHRDHLKQQVLDRMDDEMAAEFRAITERRLRLGLVIAEMGRRHGIRAQQSAELEDKVIDHLVAQAQVSARSASQEDLRGLMEG